VSRKSGDGVDVEGQGVQSHVEEQRNKCEDRKIIVYYMFYQKLDMHTFLLF